MIDDYDLENLIEAIHDYKEADKAYNDCCQGYAWGADDVCYEHRERREKARDTFKELLTKLIKEVVSS